MLDLIQRIPPWVYIAVIVHVVVLGSVAYLILLERKVAGEKPEPQARAEPTNITDLMAALEASVAAARTDRGSAKADEAEKPAAKATKRPRKAAAKQEEEPRQRRRKTA